jgi:hypothetical protein
MRLVQCYLFVTDNFTNTMHTRSFLIHKLVSQHHPFFSFTHMPLTKASTSPHPPPLPLHKHNMPHSTKPQHAKHNTSKAEEDKATLPKRANKTNSKVEGNEATLPKPPKKATSKVEEEKEEEEEATLPKPPKKSTFKVDEHTLPQPNTTTKDLYWRCCNEHHNYGGEFPQRCEECEHFWCEYCCDWHGVVDKEGLKVSE